jgi:hypothetical protein
MDNEMETVSNITEVTVAQNALTQNAESSLSSIPVIQDVMMLDTNPLLSGLANQDVTMQVPDILHSELHSMPGPSNDINMQQPVFPEFSLNQPFTSGVYAVWGEEKIKKRRCQVCVQAGRDGKTCKGNNCKHCEFIEVCSLNYFSHCLLINVDRHNSKNITNIKLLS